MTTEINEITCKAGSAVATFAGPGDRERARWAALAATEAFAFRMGMGSAAPATLCDDAQTLSERERDAMRNAILHMSAALNVDAPKGKNCADGWVLLARAVLSKVREMAVAVTP